MALLCLKSQISPGKHTFSEVIDWIVRTFESHPHSTLQLNSLVTETGIEKRRLYDLVNVLIACGICTKTDTHSYLWLGLSAFRSTARRIAREIENRSMQYDLEKLFVLRDSPAIGVLTSSFIGVFLHFGPAEINIRDAAVLMSADEASAKPIRRRLYLVAFLLERLGLVKHSDAIGGYEFATDISSIAIEVLGELAAAQQFPPNSIAYQLNRIEKPYIRRLHANRRTALARLIRMRTGQMAHTQDRFLEAKMPRIISDTPFA
jgi:hypothetical protein